MKIAVVDWVGHRAGMQCFPVYLLYRIHKKFNDAFKFVLTSRLACVPINHYCFSDVQQNIVNLLQYHSVTK